MSSRPRLASAVRRLVLRTSRTRLRVLWAAVYRGIARLAAAYVSRGERRAASYLRGEPGDLVPGLSDFDLVVVLPPGSRLTVERAAHRWRRLYPRWPWAEYLLDWPQVFDQSELFELYGQCVFTYGLDGPARRGGAVNGPDFDLDVLRSLDRPGLHGLTAGWRPLAGRSLRLDEPPRDPDRDRLAAWLELLHWWHWVFAACVDDTGPRAAHLCAKLVLEPARIWLWLAHGERIAGREAVLERARVLLPEEEEGFATALDLWRSLHLSPPAALPEVLPVLVRLSSRIAALVDEQVAPAGTTAVRLAGDPTDLVLPNGPWQPPTGGGGGAPLALCDPCALMVHRLPDEAFVPLAGDAADPATLAIAASAKPGGPSPALRADRLLVFPGLERRTTRLRAVKCRASDPVTFALDEGEAVARFPEVPGWSARDVARRAVAEQRAWLRGPARHRGDALGTLLCAARAAAFLESIDAGEPELAVTVAAAADRLAESSASPGAAALMADAYGEYRAFATQSAEPSETTISALRREVLALGPYRAEAAAVVSGR